MDRQGQAGTGSLDFHPPLLPCLSCTKLSSHCGTRSRALGMCLEVPVPPAAPAPFHPGTTWPCRLGAGSSCTFSKQGWSRDPRTCTPALVPAGWSLVLTLSTSPPAGL